jgi:tetratricopeptide (TPR) repeat protein
MRACAVLAVVGLMVMGSACASKPAPAASSSVPAFPQFDRPPVPDTFRGSDAALAYDRGWRFFQAGDLKNAERELTLALSASAAFYPAEAALGDLELIRQDLRAALPHFDRAIERRNDYVPALIGRGQALAGLNRDEEAASAFEAAMAVDGSLGDLRRRVDVLRFRGLGRDLAEARQAARAGKLADASRLYQSAIAGSPDSAFLYRELATVDRQQGDTDRALAHLRQATRLDPADAASFAQIGELLEARGAPGDADGAVAAYASALAIEPDATVEARRNALGAGAPAAAVAGLPPARLPERYRAIPEATQIMRADLAALIGIRLAALLQTSRVRDAVVITDARSNWAESWIMSVVSAGVMEAYENHTFQPRALVRRVDLAQATSRLLQRIAAVAPAQARPWDAARVRFTDIAQGHLAYPAASVAVAAGVMTIGPDGAFQPQRFVTGSEAIEAIDRVEQLIGPPAARDGVRR